MRAMLMTVRRACRMWMQRRSDRRIVRARLRKLELETRDFERVIGFTRHTVAA